MGPRAPLAVRINDGTTDRHVTSAVRNLSFRKTAPGGFTAASMQVSLPRNAFTDLGPADRVWISDGRTGQTVWEGFTQNPGVLDGPSGQGFDLSCLGTTILASDESRALIYIDKTLDNFESDPLNGPSSTFETGESATFPGFYRLRTQLTPGQPVTTGTFASAGNYSMERAGMYLGAAYATVVSGKADTGYRTTFNTPGGAINIADITQMTTSPSSVSLWAGTNFTSGTIQRFAWRLVRSGGATNIADDNTWTDFVDPHVLGQRMDRNGTLLVGSAGMVTNLYVLASWVVEDLLGRVFTWADKGLSRVDTTTYQIDQLAYADGVRGSALLDDLSLWEPDFVWEILHSTPNGYVVNYRAWPTTARYEISTRDGYNQTGSDVDLCNRIAVYWTDSKGNRNMTPRGASVPALGNASPVLSDGSRNPSFVGRVRDAEPITLPDGQGSLANAQRIGDQELAVKANPPKAATAVVRRPILDLLTGNTAYPWEIEPGYLVSVRETGDVLRLTEMEYVDNDCAASLTLGTPALTSDQRIARLANKAA
jgi:hypothetical protein